MTWGIQRIPRLTGIEESIGAGPNSATQQNPALKSQERHCAVRARFAGNVDDLDARFLERVLRLHLEPDIVVRNRIIVDPVVEEAFDLGPGRVPADLVAHHRLQIMRKARHGQDVRKLR